MKMEGQAYAAPYALAGQRAKHTWACLNRKYRRGFNPDHKMVRLRAASQIVVPTWGRGP